MIASRIASPSVVLLTLATACTLQPADAPPPDARTVPMPGPTPDPAPGASAAPVNPGTPSPAPGPTGRTPTSRTPAPDRSCPELDCQQDCEHGYLKDARGCPACMCAPDPADQRPGIGGGACTCQADADCVKVQDAGCCGCNAGGTEMAVAKACLDRVPKCEQRDVMCPQVYKCTERKAVCQRGQCMLK